MSEKIVRINNMENYTSVNKKYGILVRSMKETAIINFDSNMGGIAVNIAHGDYSILPSDMYEIRDGKVFVYDYEEHGYIDAGLMIWSD